MSLEVRIVSTREKHLSSFHQCLSQVARERHWLAFAEVPPLEAVHAFGRSLVARGAPHVVAISNKKVVGWCDVIPNDQPGFEHSGRLSTGLLAPYRGQGYGKALVRKAVKQAQKFGMWRIELEVFGSNREAMVFFDGLGFQIEGIKKRALKLDGELDDLVLMARILEPLDQAVR